MAETNPHEITTGGKLVNYDALKRYHHALIEKLGLVQDTAAYQYNGERSDFPEGIKSIAEALDNVYDLAKSGAITFESGKADDSSASTVEFNSSDEEDSNIYWIHAQVGDETVNIKLDADAFVKDSFLKEAFILTVETSEVEGTATTSYKVNGADAEFDKDEDNNDTLGGKIVEKAIIDAIAEDGTYFAYTWALNEGEKGISYTTTTIAVKDIYGDLSADEDYIHFDETKNEFSAVVNEVVAKTTEAEEIPVKFTINTHDGIINVYEQTGDGEYADEPFDTIDGQFSSKEDVAALLAAKGYSIDNDYEYPENASADAYGNQLVGGTKTWEVSDSSIDGLVTAENLASVAQDLQDQIDEAISKMTLNDGDIVFDDDSSAESKLEVVEDSSNGGVHYKLTLAIASDDDIENLFNVCGGAESISEISTVNNGETITAPGEYKINVGESPVGSTTDIKWTKND